METTIQTERLQVNEAALDVIGEEVIHRAVAASLIKNMPFDMLRRFLPLKVGGKDGIIKMEMRVEA